MDKQNNIIRTNKEKINNWMIYRKKRKNVKLI